jgi:hypothetical protein
VAAHAGWPAREREGQPPPLPFPCSPSLTSFLTSSSSTLAPADAASSDEDGDDTGGDDDTGGGESSSGESSDDGDDSSSESDGASSSASADDAPPRGPSKSTSPAHYLPLHGDASHYQTRAEMDGAAPTSPGAAPAAGGAAAGGPGGAGGAPLPPLEHLSLALDPASARLSHAQRLALRARMQGMKAREIEARLVASDPLLGA